MNIIRANNNRFLQKKSIPTISFSSTYVDVNYIEWINCIQWKNSIKKAADKSRIFIDNCQLSVTCRNKVKIKKEEFTKTSAFALEEIGYLHQKIISCYYRTNTSFFEDIFQDYRVVHCQSDREFD